MKVATLLFYAVATFLLGQMALVLLTPAELFTSGRPGAIDNYQMAGVATYVGAGLFLLLALLQLLWEIAHNRGPQD